MGLARAPLPHKGYVGRKGVVTFTHSMLIGATGGITSQDTAGGILAARNSAGNYTLTLLPAGQTFKRAIGLTCDLVPSPAVVPIAASGLTYVWFSNNLATAANTIVLQWINASNAAADITSGGTVFTVIDLEAGI